MDRKVFLEAVVRNGFRFWNYFEFKENVVLGVYYLIFIISGQIYVGDFESDKSGFIFCLLAESFNFYSLSQIYK